MKKIKVAVIGTGNMGQHHVRIYKELENVKLVAVCDLDVNRAREIAHKNHTRYFKKYETLLSKIPDLDIASIVVPTQYHKDVACYFLNHKVNVLVEKPIADNIKNAKKIIDTALKNKVKLTVGHVERFNPAVVKLKEIIDQGKLGKITSLLARRVGGFPSQIRDHNVIIDLAVHDVDIFNFLISEKPKRVYLHKSRVHSKIQEDSGEIFLIYNNIAGFIQINWVTPLKIRELSVTGTKGYAQLNYVTQDLILYATKAEIQTDNFSELIKLATPKIIPVKVKKEEPLKLELQNFVNCVKDNKIPFVDPNDALESLKICLTKELYA